MTCNISDHLPIFTFTTKKRKHQDRAPLQFKCRSMSETNINNIITSLTNSNLAVLDNMTPEEGYNYFIDIKEVIIHQKHIIREQTKDKLHRKYIHQIQKSIP